ncbi:MAG: hypothetical protein KGJ86_07935 [Chloroflexota bacterium]|nr:hypothetical protein [Chloroflexota bacterium]
MLQLHQVFSTAVLLVLLLLGLWGVIAGTLKRPVGGSYRSTYLLSAMLIGVQDVIGLVLFFSGPRPGTMLHLLYGAVPLIVLFGAFSYSTDVTPRREALTFGIAALFCFILVFVRTIPTGGH